MSDNSELKGLLDYVVSLMRDGKVKPDSEKFDRLSELTTPWKILELISENERNAKNAKEWEEASLHWMNERDQLKAENEALKGPHDWLAEDLIKELVDNAQAFQENACEEGGDPFVIVLLAAASRIRRQEASLHQLKTEKESLRKDAERYRKIRQGAIHDEVDAGIYILDQRGEKYQECAVMISEDDLDNAIDSAMSKEP